MVWIFSFTGCTSFCHHSMRLMRQVLSGHRGFVWRMSCGWQKETPIEVPSPAQATFRLGFCLRNLDLLFLLIETYYNTYYIKNNKSTWISIITNNNLNINQYNNNLNEYCFNQWLCPLMLVSPHWYSTGPSMDPRRTRSFRRWWLSRERRKSFWRRPGDLWSWTTIFWTRPSLHILSYIHRWS